MTVTPTLPSRLVTFAGFTRESTIIDIGAIRGEEFGLPFTSGAETLTVFGVSNLGEFDLSL